jgi:DNA-3-methyladenine glycosylase I
VKTPTRCPWVNLDDPLYVRYHDTEWGKPVHDDKTIFEFLILEIFQAGLSWRTVLHKRENFRTAFSGFNVRRVARYTSRDVTRLLGDAGIIRNRQKIEAAIENAKRFLDVQREYGSFSTYMWSWVGGTTIPHRLRTLKDYPPFTPEAVAWAKDLKRRGFRFLGPTVLYAHMQAVGMVNDHVLGCMRRSKATTKSPRSRTSHRRGPSKS